MKETATDQRISGRFYQDAKLRKSLGELREIRDRTRKRALVVSIILAVLCLLIGLVFNEFLVVGLVGAIAVYKFMVRGVRRKYKQLVVPTMLKEIDPGLVYQQSGCIRKETFRKSRLFTEDINSYSGEDLVSGSYRGIPVCFSTLNVKEITWETDSKGHPKPEYVTFFNGVFFIADFNKDFKYCHWVLPDTAEALLGQVVGNFLQKFDLSGRGHMTRMEDPEFEKRFSVYTENDVEARYILTPKLMQTMVKLSRSFGSYSSGIRFGFIDSNVYVAIPFHGDHKLFDMPMSGDLGEQAVLATMGELEEILSIFEVMELDLRLWSKASPGTLPDAATNA